MPIDLTKFCALCGGELRQLSTCPAFGSSQDVEQAVLYFRDGPRHRWLNTEFKPCTCTSRTDRGKCGDCKACNVERHGCACDGAYDDGCFKCAPERYTRPPCPDLYEKVPADEHTQETS